MRSDHIHGEWVATPVHYEGVNLWPEQQHGYAYGGLLIVPAYDDELGFWPDSWAIWHQASGLDLLEVRASLERTMQVAGHLAKMADWPALGEPDWIKRSAPDEASCLCSRLSRIGRQRRAYGAEQRLGQHRALPQRRTMLGVQGEGRLNVRSGSAEPKR